jgi:hypothetical protein
MALRASTYRRKLGAVRRRIARRLGIPTRPPARSTTAAEQQKARLQRAIAAYEAATANPLPTGDVARAAAGAEIVRTRKALLTALGRSAEGPRTLIATARELSRRRRFREAGALITRAGKIDTLSPAARAAEAVVAVARGRFEAADEALRALPRETALGLAPAEVVAVEFSVDPAAAVATCETVLAGARRLDPGAWLSLARTTFGRGEVELSARALGRIRGKQGTLPEHIRVEKRWLKRWIDRARVEHPPAPVPSGHVAFALLDYKQPDYRQVSANVGDYVQTLASLGHLLRHQDLRFHGDDALVESLTELQARVQPVRRLTGIERDVTVLTINRDASSLDQVPEGTWMLAFGWYMHNWFKIRWDFPFHPNLRPVFISFHINHPEALSEESLRYLADHAPIGCRDWDTVDRLLGVGIPAFFSGCLTTTVDQLFPVEPPAPATDAPVALVDLPPGKAPAVSGPSSTIRHSGIGVRSASFVTNLKRAVQLLDAYRTDFSRVITGRLHCYLPVRALGVEVDFVPKNLADIRFDGLIGIDDASFVAMQEGIRSKLETVLGAILRGDDEESVRKLWHEVCADDVAAAERRHQALTP